MLASSLQHWHLLVLQQCRQGELYPAIGDFREVEFLEEGDAEKLLKEERIWEGCRAVADHVSSLSAWFVGLRVPLFQFSCLPFLWRSSKCLLCWLAIFEKILLPLKMEKLKKTKIRRRAVENATRHFIFSQGEGKQKSQIFSLQVMMHCTNKIRILLCFLIFRPFHFLMFCIFLWSTHHKELHSAIWSNFV